MRVKRINDKATLPTHGSKEAAGWDLYALIESGGVIAIKPKETEIIHTGIIVEVPQGYFGGIYARSGLATKRGLRPSNCTGVVDSDFRGEVLVGLYNDSDETQIVCHGDRVAQMIIQPYAEKQVIEEVTEVSKTDRGTGGFGSTGS